MNVEFLKSFSKDLDNIDSRQVKQAVLKIIVMMEAAPDLNHLSNVKKLRGHKNAYRIRLGDYRLGFFLEGTIILLARLVHRKDIYKLFP